jgi:hypothetical protein
LILAWNTDLTGVPVRVLSCQGATLSLVDHNNKNNNNNNNNNNNMVSREELLRGYPQLTILESRDPLGHRKMTRADYCCVAHSQMGLTLISKKSLFWTLKTPISVLKSHTKLIYTCPASTQFECCYTSLKSKRNFHTTNYNNNCSFFTITPPHASQQIFSITSHPVLCCSVPIFLLYTI